MKKYLMNGLAAGFILVVLGIMAVAEHSAVLSSGWRKLLDVLLVLVLYGFIWIWVKNRAVDGLQEQYSARYQIQTWSSTTQIENYLEQPHSQLSLTSSTEAGVKLELSESPKVNLSGSGFD